MSIHGIRLRNFRGFQEASIELKPLTVLLGPNSSGKSAFGHALAAMAHAQWRHSGSVHASLTPKTAKEAEEWPIDLGRYADLHTEGIDDRVYVDLLTPEGYVDFGFGKVPDLPDLRLSYIAHPFGLSSSATVPVSTPTSAKAPFEAQSGTGSVTRAEMPEVRLELKRINDVQWQDRGDVPIAVGLKGLLLTTVRHENGSTEFVISGKARDDVRLLLENLCYLRATRKRPTRGYEQGKGDSQEIGYAGEWAASLLLDRAKDKVKLVKLPAIPNSVDEARAVLDAPLETQNRTLADAVSMWLKWLVLATSVEAVKSSRYDARVETHVTIVPNQRPRDITEVGFGLSQVLPILVAGLLQPDSSLFIVDLPEAHLHPRPQGSLADFFCSLALTGRSALVETHSEMFFNQLRLRAAMNRELMDKIVVYFIDSPEAGLCKKPREVGLNLSDQVRWPRGFLQEAWEIETQIRAIREARNLARV